MNTVEKEWVGRIESSTETYITMHKIDSQVEFAIWCRELKHMLCDNLQGWDRVEGGRKGHRYA